MLKEGEKAPAFALASVAGGTEKLAAYKGKHVVVYFYPKDDTPGCTRECIAFSALAAQFEKAGAKVFGVSKDSLASHEKFRAKHRLAVPLLSDPGLEAHRAFGAFGTKTMYGRKVEGTIRSTFLIDPDGVVVKVWPNVKVDGHAEAVLAALDPSEGDGAARKVGAKKTAPKETGAKKAAPKKKGPRKTGANEAASKKTGAKKTAKKAAPKKAGAKKAAKTRR